MNYQILNSRLSVTGQLTPDDVATAATLGFRSIVCNRPDGEAAGQAAFADVNSTSCSPIREPAGVNRPVERRPPNVQSRCR